MAAKTRRARTAAASAPEPVKHRVFCEFLRGSGTKLVTEVLSEMLGEKPIILVFSRDGLRINHVNASGTMLLDSMTPISHFRRYRLRKPSLLRAQASGGASAEAEERGHEYVVAVVARHLQRILKNLRKKDVVTLFVEQNDKERLGISINQSDSIQRIETSHITANKVVPEKLRFVPLHSTDEDGRLVDNFWPPHKLASAEFQKTKKIAANVSDFVHFDLYKDRYISFYGGDQNTYSTRVEIGSLDDVGSSEDEYSALADPDGEDANEDSGEDAGADADGDDEEREESSHQPPKLLHRFHGSFDKETMQVLLKLPGIDANMNFYAPRVSMKTPLKIEMINEGIGTVTCFVFPNETTLEEDGDDTDNGEEEDAAATGDVVSEDSVADASASG